MSTESARASIPRRLLHAVPLLLVLATGCGRTAQTDEDGNDGNSDSDFSEPTCEQRIEAFELPPSPGGWTTTVDGHECQHPVVEVDCTDGWCRIPAGCFVMGSPKSEPRRGAEAENEVSTTLTRSFAIMQTEVTQELWSSLIPHNPSGSVEDKFDAEGTWTECVDPKCPVTSVSWFEAVHFANLLSENDGLPACYEMISCTGTPGDINDVFECQDVVGSPENTYACEGYRLPTEAEFEYAMRAGTRSAYPSGEVPDALANGNAFQCLSCEPVGDAIAWTCGNSQSETHPVGQLLPNQWGLRDMMGNASEWVLDEDVTTPGLAPWVDPLGEVTVTDLNRTARKVKGGAFFSSLIHARSAASGSGRWERHSLGQGFRLVRTAIE